MYWYSLYISRFIVNINSVQCNNFPPMSVITHRLLHCVFTVLPSTLIYGFVQMIYAISVVGVLWAFSRMFWRRDDARSTVLELASSDLQFARTKKLSIATLYTTKSQNKIHLECTAQFLIICTRWNNFNFSCTNRLEDVNYQIF